MRKNQLFLTLVGLLSFGTFAQEATAEAVTKVVEPVVTVVPNYSKNLDLFIASVILTAVLLFAIAMLSYSIKTLLSSDTYVDKLLKRRNEDAKNGSKTLPLLILGVFLFAGNHLMALTFKPGEEDMPWLRIENTDLIFMLVLNIILLGIVLYLRRMFNQLVENVRIKKEQEVKEVARTFSKLNSILIGSVPIEKEEKIVLDHEYDGIRELDNNLPPWWVWMFFATVIFAIVYMFHYHVIKTGDLQIAEYNKEIKQAEKDVQEYLSKMAMNVDETNATLMTEESDLSAGKSIFANNCIACHKEKGEGNIGPNLTDEYWLTSNDIKALFQVIKSGTANGMPEHASKLNPIQIQQVASFVLSLPYTPGKDPEGEKMEKKVEETEGTEVTE